MSKFDSKKFQDESNSMSWNEIIDIGENDIHKCFNYFFNKFSLLFDKHVPLARPSKRQFKTKTKPWLTKDLLDLMKVRDKLYGDFKKNPINKHLLFSQFKSCRNRIVIKFFNEDSNNVQKIWKGVREIITSKSSKTIIRI